MIRKIIRLTESDISEMVKKSVVMILNESQESKSISQAKRLVMNKLGYNEAEADKFVRIELRNDIPILRTPQGGKFILGATRMFLNGQLRTANDINNLNSTLKLVSSDAHINEYDRNLNGMSAQELIQRFAKTISDDLEAEWNKVNNMSFNESSDYNIIRIDSFEQSKQYGRYTTWCVTSDQGMFDSYTSNGLNQFYFCLRNGFENEKRQPSKGCPLDSYGLSMIAVSVNENGMLNTCTCRWNHDHDGNDSIMNSKQLSEVLKVNFFNVFKPNNKWNKIVENAEQRLANGENIEEVFDSTFKFKNGFARVVLKGKCNFINTNVNILSKQWFDWCSYFKDGNARVRLNGKEYVISTNGRLL